MSAKARLRYLAPSTHRSLPLAVVQQPLAQSEPQAECDLSLINKPRDMVASQRLERLSETRLRNSTEPRR